MYVPFCGLAVIDALSVDSNGVEDPLLREQQQQDGRYEVRRRAGRAPHTRCYISRAYFVTKIVCVSVCVGLMLSDDGFVQGTAREAVGV